MTDEKLGRRSSEGRHHGPYNCLLISTCRDIALRGVQLVGKEEGRKRDGWAQSMSRIVGMRNEFW
jgi:hypothetical protein